MEDPINFLPTLTFHPLCDLDQDELAKCEGCHLLERKSIKLLTYNIFLRPPPLKNNEDDFKDERTSEFKKLLNNFDIICLQEMFGAFNNRKHEIIRTATQSGFFYYVDTASPIFLSKYLVDGGLLILSRFPIINYNFYVFRYGVIADALAQKGLLYAKIQIKDTYLHLFTTHLQASYYSSNPYHWDVSFSTRMYQIEQINNIMKETLKQEYSKKDKILLVGDFNVDAMSYKYKKPEGASEAAIKDMETEYNKMMEHLNSDQMVTIDLFKEHLQSPVTYGDKDEESGFCESALTDHADLGSKLTLDFMFECFFDNEDRQVEKKLQIDYTSLKVEKFLVENMKKAIEQHSFTQLSDHYGLSLDIKYNSKVKNLRVLKSLIHDDREYKDKTMLTIDEEGGNEKSQIDIIGRDERSNDVSQEHDHDADDKPFINK